MTRPARFIIDILPLALDDLRWAHSSVASDSPEMADFLYGRLMTAIRTMEYFPLRHPLATERRFRKAGVRTMVIASYRVYYAPIGSHVLVLRVWHSARQPPPGPLI